MSVTSETAEHFDFGRVGSQISGLISRNFVPFVILGALLGGLPQLIVVVVNSMMPTPTSPADFAAAYGASSILLRFILIFVLMLPGFVLQAALTRASIDDLSGKPVSVGNSIQVGLANLFPLFGLAIVLSLGVGVGVMLFVVPGLILLCCWIVAAPALVVEKLGIFASMQRSLNLTRGHRWAMFGIIVLFYIIIFFVVASIVTLVTTGSVGFAAMLAAQRSITYGLLNAIVGTFIAIITSVGIAAIYFELRRIKEGVGVTDLASVFD